MPCQYLQSNFANNLPIFFVGCKVFVCDRSLSHFRSLLVLFPKVSTRRVCKYYLFKSLWLNFEALFGAFFRGRIMLFSNLV